jgi:hypothetical protein
MKNALLWSPATDRKILLAAGIFCALALAVAVGSALPAPEAPDMIRLLDGFIAAILLVLARRRTVDWSSLPCEGRFWERKLGPAKIHHL